MSRNTVKSLLASTIALPLLLAGCAPTGSGENTGSDGDTIKIGYIAALSGGSASMGVPGLNGIELAIEDVNAQGGVNGKKLQLISYDDKADPATSATAAQKLVNEDGVIAVIGGPNSGTVKANNVIITGAGVVQLVAIASEDSLIDSSLDGFNLTFHVTENNTYDISATASLIVEEGYKNICAVADTTAYGDGGMTSMTKVFDTFGLKVSATQRHEVNANDLTPQVLGLRDASCDVVYLYSLANDGALFMKTMKQVGWDVPVIGGRGLSAKSFLSLGGADADGLILPGVVDSSRAEAKAFIKKYDAKNGADDDPSHNFSALGYDSVLLLVEGLKASNGEGGEALAKALESVKLTNGVSGREGATMSFSADDHRAPDDNYIVFLEIKDGTYQFLTRDFDAKAN